MILRLINQLCVLSLALCVAMLLWWAVAQRYTRLRITQHWEDRQTSINVSVKGIGWNRDGFFFDSSDYSRGSSSPADLDWLRQSRLETCGKAWGTIVVWSDAPGSLHDCWAISFRGFRGLEARPIILSSPSQ